jgi:aconitate hydratase
VLPLQFLQGQGVEELGLTGREIFTIQGLSDEIQPQDTVTVVVEKEEGQRIEFSTTVRLDTQVEVIYYRNGGILHTVLRNMIEA